MSHFGNNIKKIRTIKKLSQTQFAELFGLSRANVGSYEEGRAEAKIDIIIAIAKYFSISVESILTKELSVNELMNFNLVDKVQSNLSVQSKKNIIPYVNIENYNKYIANFNNAEFVNSLPIVQLPFSAQLVFRAFEHSDNEMQNLNTGIFNGDLLICTYTNINNLKLNKIYVVVCENFIFARELVRFDTEFTFKSANNKETVVLKAEINEVWELKGVYSTRLEYISDLEKRILELEKKVGNM